MSLHYPTLGSVLLTVGILTSVMMIFIWRLYYITGHQPLGSWSTTDHVRILSHVAGTNAWQYRYCSEQYCNNYHPPLLIFEGAIRFKGGLHPLDHVRVPFEILYGIGYLLSTLLNIQNARGRYMINDLLMMIVLALTIVVLLWKVKGLERIVYIIIAVTFALMFIAFFFRWLFSLLNSDFLNDPNQVLTPPIIFFTLVPPWLSVGLMDLFSLSTSREDKHSLTQPVLTCLRD